MVSAAAMVLLTAGLVSAQTPNFSGKWTCTDCPAPGGGGGGGGRGGGGGGLGPEFTATQDAATLKIDRTMGQNAVSMVYKLDGSESKNMTMGRGGQTEQVSKAAWTGGKLVISTTIPNGVRTMTLSMEGGNLVVETLQPARDGGPGTPVKRTYKKG
jgi:hypothetical protein